MNEAMLKTCMEQCNSTSENVGIFVDFDNIYYSLREYGVNPEAPEYCVFSLMERIYSINKIRTLRAYADYDQVGVSLKHLQEMRVQIKNVYGNGLEEEYRKNASDIALSVDALEIYYRSPEIDTFVFLTSDSDMIPIMSRLTYKGKHIHLFCIDDHQRKNPEFWTDRALTEISAWYSVRKNSDMMLGGKWLNRLLCEKLQISSRAASRIITYLKDNHLIHETSNSAGHTGFFPASSL